VIKEVIVVEGKQDVQAVKRAVDAECIITGGFTLAPYSLKKIEQAYERRGIIILTDPDSAGERIRKFLSKRFPSAKHAFVPREAATANNDVGIEQASSEAIRAALLKVRCEKWEPAEEFSWQDIMSTGLSGTKDAAERRGSVGALLGIGYANAKGFLYRLNHYGVSREEFTKAIGGE
jgi:ribonuclease M5